MAKLTVSGLGDVIKQLEQISTLDGGKLAKSMLKQGSVPVAEEWKKVAQMSHSTHYNLQGRLVKSTGQMMRSVETKKVKKNKYGYFTVTYPQGLEEYVTDRPSSSEMLKRLSLITTVSLTSSLASMFRETDG